MFMHLHVGSGVKVVFDLTMILVFLNLTAKLQNEESIIYSTNSLKGAVSFWHIFNLWLALPNLQMGLQSIILKQSEIHK